MSNHRARHLHTTPRGGWYALWPVWAICISLILFAAFAVVWGTWVRHPQESDVPVIVLGEGHDLHFDRSKLSHPPLHLFEARAAGQQVTLLVQRTQDKTVHVAIASCQNCYRSAGSHYARNGEMICGQCNRAMSFEAKDETLATDKCALVEIPHTETNHDIVVSTREVFAQEERILQ